MNTAIPVGISPGAGFDAWKTYNRSQPDMDIAALMKRGTPVLSDAEAAAYAAPFVDQTYKAGVRRFPELVMVSPDMEGVEVARRAAAWWANDWSGQSFHGGGHAGPRAWRTKHARPSTTDQKLPGPHAGRRRGSFRTGMGHAHRARGAEGLG